VSRPIEGIFIYYLERSETRLLSTKGRNTERVLKSREEIAFQLKISLAKYTDLGIAQLNNFMT